MNRIDTWLCWIALLGIAGCASVPSTLLTDELSKGAYRQVLNETMWIDGAVYGYAGDIENRTATATRLLAGHEKARAIFLRLLADAKPAGKLYALCGLYYADWDEFQKQVEALRHDPREVSTTTADVVGPQRICDIVFCPYRDKDRERIVLKRGQTLHQWLKENKGKKGYGDISGGVYPENIVNPDSEQK
ncbi:MAG: hypothetical protein PHR77_02685 [Kiritimatiellae bacterium]|nr:hypothetical protein [Kiritimatiellia bacterium]MDD5523261.1 hypothetical protein [Kiritimatiellia bacterium]